MKKQPPKGTEKLRAKDKMIGGEKRKQDAG